MLGKSFAVLIVISLIFSLVTGNGESLGAGALDGASAAVTTAISLSGMMVLWNGIMAVLQDAGITRRLARLMSPFLSKLFPRAFSSGEGKEEICAALCANFFGIGNAATPLALCAMKKLDSSREGSAATDDMIMLSLCAVSPVSLLPTTVIALRRSAGCSDPFKVIVPVWICSAATFIFTVVLASVCRAATSRRRAP